jgi:SAM-dependent methyltransferase
MALLWVRSVYYSKLGVAAWARPAAIALFPLRSLFRRVEDRAEARTERSLGIDTSPPAFTRSHTSDIHFSRPTRYSALARLVDYLDLRDDDVFVDIGCGSGRVVCFVAAHCRAARVIGVEILPGLADAARRNAASCSCRSPVEIVHADAKAYGGDSGSVYFLNNPFGPETLAAVLENIRASTITRPRPVRIAYHAPTNAHVVDALSWLIPEATLHTAPATRIWRTAHPAG